MHYQIEALNDFRHKISVTLDEDEVRAGFERTYADFAYRFPFEGYAPGMAPRDVIDAAFGPAAVASTVATTLSESSFGRAVGEADLVAIGEPAYADFELPEEGKPFSFEAEIDCSPRYELTSYEPVCIKLPDIGFNPAMQQALQKMRENEALHILQERVEGFIPEILVDTQEQLQLQSIYAKANEINLPFEAYLLQQRIDPERFKAELEEQATEMVRRNLALDAWGRHIGIEVTDEQIAANFERSGVPYPALEEARWRENGRISELRQAIRRAGAMRNLMETLVIEKV